MGIVDIVICLCLIPAVVAGISKGFIRQAISLLVIWFGITLSIRFADNVSAWILKYVTISPFWLKIISFVLIWAAVAVILTLLGKLLTGILKFSMLGWLDRLLGAVTAIAIAIILLSLAASLLDSINGTFGFLPKKEMSESRLFPMLLDASNSIFPHLKQLF